MVTDYVINSCIDRLMDDYIGFRFNEILITFSLDVIQKVPNLKKLYNNAFDYKQILPQSYYINRTVMKIKELRTRNFTSEILMRFKYIGSYQESQEFFKNLKQTLIYLLGNNSKFLAVTNISIAITFNIENIKPDWIKDD